MAAKIAKQDRAGVRDDVRELSKRDDRARTIVRQQAALTARLVRRARGCWPRPTAAGTIYVPERLHALRIAIKKLRYALELLPATPAFDVADALEVIEACAASLRSAPRHPGAHRGSAGD